MKKWDVKCQTNESLKSIVKKCAAPQLELSPADRHPEGNVFGIYWIFRITPKIFLPDFYGIVLMRMCFMKYLCLSDFAAGKMKLLKGEKFRLCDQNHQSFIQMSSPFLIPCKRLVWDEGIEMKTVRASGRRGLDQIGILVFP